MTPTPPPSDLSGLCGCDGPTRRDPNCKWHNQPPLGGTLAQEIPCVVCGATESRDGDWYRVCGECRWAASVSLDVEQVEAALAAEHAKVAVLEQERDALLLDRHQPHRLSPCGHYRVFAMPLLHEDGLESPYCMQCDRDGLQTALTAERRAHQELQAVLGLVEFERDHLKAALLVCQQERDYLRDVIVRQVERIGELSALKGHDG